jgi:hypothetical protein
MSGEVGGDFRTEIVFTTGAIMGGAVLGGQEEPYTYVPMVAQYMLARPEEKEATEYGDAPGLSAWLIAGARRERERESNNVNKVFCIFHKHVFTTNSLILAYKTRAIWRAGDKKST